MKGNEVMRRNLGDISTELKTLFDADQADRAGVYGEEGQQQKMEQNDPVRLARAHEIYAEFKAGNFELAGNDLYHIAMIFQHGVKAGDFKRAHECATLSADSGCEDAKWLSSATEDRYLLTIGEKQKWGTQFRKEKDGAWEQAPMASDEESGVTDALRKEKNVPARAEQMGIFLARKDI